MTKIQFAITQAVAEESPSKRIHGEFVFGTIFYMFVSNVLIRHDLGIWNKAVLDGMDEWSALEETEQSVSYRGLFNTLGGELGWRAPIGFDAVLRGNSIDYEFSIGTNPDHWKRLSDDQVQGIGAELMSRRPDFKWVWAESMTGTIALTINAVY